MARLGQQPGEHERGYGFAGRRGRRRGRGEEHSAPRELGPARAIGEEAKVSNADEAARDDVEEKTTDELLGLEGHHLHAVVVRVVLPAKSYEAVSVTEEAVVGDRHPVRVAPEVLEDLGGASQGPFRVHDPGVLPKLLEPGGEGAGLGEGRDRSGEHELAGREGAPASVPGPATGALRAR